MYSVIVFYEGSNGQATENAAFQAYNSFDGHPNLYYGYMAVDVSNDNNGLADQLNVTAIPTVVFVRWIDDLNFETITRIEGHSNYNQIRAAFENVLNENFGSGNQNGNGENYPIPGNGENFSFGFFGLGKGGFALGLLLLLLLASRRNKN